MIEKICAIFGETPDELVFGYDEEHYLCGEMKMKLVCAIKMMTDMGYRTFCSTVDQGSEMWAAEACLAMKSFGCDTEFIAAVTAHDRADKWHPERRERYFNVLSACDCVVEPEDDTFGVDYVLEASDAVIIQGCIENSRLSKLRQRAQELGRTVYCVE